MALITSILTGGVNNHETTSEQINGFYTDFVVDGIVDEVTATSGVAPMTGGYAVNEQDTPAMAVDVSTGVAYVTATPTSQASQTFRVKNNTTAEVTIDANSSGSTKYDWIYITLDATNLNAPNTAGDNAATLTTSRSSSAATDDGTPPTYGYAIAVVTVANGASSITDANITDKRIQTGSVPGDGTVDTDQLADNAVTPSKRSGGFYIGSISGATLGTTGNKAITGVGFTPKLVRFKVVPSSSATAATEGTGAMTASSQYYAASTSTNTPTSSRNGSTSACIGWLGTGSTPLFLAAYVSMNADGFTINVTTANSAFDVAYEAYA